MGRQILIIPDVHLKPVMFNLADDILHRYQVDLVVQMGDLMDDWGHDRNIRLYEATLNRAIKFNTDHPGTLWVLGNHDYGYLHPGVGSSESGHSLLASPFVYPLLQKIPQQVMHIVDGVIFTHAGLTKEWAFRQLELAGFSDPDMRYPNDEKLLDVVNHAGMYELWREESPIWARPQIDKYDMYPAELQVVGHTPVETARQDEETLSTDVFSTMRDGTPIGDQKFVLLDTETKKWERVL